MCDKYGIKMLHCSELKSLNDWNAIWFFFTSILIWPTWLWIYYVVTVRLQENAVAAETGTTTVLDCAPVACFNRLRETVFISNDNNYSESQEEGGMAQQFATKFASKIADDAPGGPQPQQTPTRIQSATPARSGQVPRSTSGSGGSTIVRSGSGGANV